MTDDKPNTDDWSTPAWLIDQARLVLGRIDLDPASSALAQQIVRATAYYTKADDGLAQPWRGSTWLNPPYSEPHRWVRRLISHYEAGEVTSALLLLNTANSPVWSQELWNSPYPVCLLKQRVKFWHIDKPGADATRSDQMLWYLGKEVDRFVDVFQPFGAIRVAYQINRLSGTKCEVCKRRFAPSRADAIYCGAACRQWAKRRRSKLADPTG